jgi:hypothetical protein
MPFSKRSSCAARAAFLILLPLSAGEGFARERRLTVHKMQPLSSERNDDIIHEFPPLRPVGPSATQQAPRGPVTAPTLEEAPRQSSDGPTLAELGVPTQPEPRPEPPERFVASIRPSVFGDYLAPFASSPLAETDLEAGMREEGSGEIPRPNLITLRGAHMDLDHFLAPELLTGPVRTEAPTAPSPSPKKDEGGPLFPTAYRIAAGLVLAVLLLLALTYRERLRAGVLALVAARRGGRTSQPEDKAAAEPTQGKILGRLRRRRQEEEAPPPIDLSRLDRLTRGTGAPTTTPPGTGDVAGQSVAASADSGVVPASDAAPGADPTDDLVLVEPGDAAAASAAIDAARARQEGTL